MTELLDGLDLLGRWSVPALWLPLLAWTLLALPVYAALRRTDRWHPLVRYRLHEALLFALPVGLGAAVWIDASGLSTWLATVTSGSGEGPGLIPLPLGPTADGVTPMASDATRLTVYHAVGALTGSALLLGSIRLARLIRSSLAIRRLHEKNAAATDGAMQHQVHRLATTMGIRRPVTVKVAEDSIVPMTYGLLQPTILLPRALATRPDRLRMALTHELIHIRRCDFLARWVEQFVAALFAIHPGVAYLSRSVEAAREMACDAETLRQARCSRKVYADLLCGFVALPPQRPAFVLSIAESSSLKQRIRAMTRLQRFTNHVPRYTSLLAAALLTVLGLGIVACSDAVTPPTGEEAPEEAATQSTTSDEEVFIVVEQRPELIGGIEALQEIVEYPAAAKEAGIEGKVFVQFTVDEQGNVQNPQVTRGVHALLDRAALEAVEQLEFEPGKQRGQAVKVQMSLPFTFKLPTSDAAQ